ncbi:unnamed protein product [Adineta ricciae]|uniref:G-protein coupled receptors family 1 profile domain-containing protein n=1 Tax=Adineta ricciae TaxID=249248 RepID=A0A814E995_ADIRI|nr:unnamed protein product [Adineta ricciae]
MDYQTGLVAIWERNIKFCLIVMLVIPSFCCTIFSLYHFNLRRFHSQIYGLLLLVNLLFFITDLPFTLAFLYCGSIPVNKCTLWIFFNYLLATLNILLMTWASIERYLFIYHDSYIRRHIFALHYMPTIVIILYSIVYYVVVILLNSCQPSYNTYLYVCAGACYQYEFKVGLIDVFIHGILSVCIIFIINLTLILRHIVYIYRRKQRAIQIKKSHHWRRSIKLTAQLLTISILYLIVWIPYTTVVFLQMYNNTPFLTYLMSTFIVYLPYIMFFSLPFLCLLAMPDIKKKFFGLVDSPPRVIYNREKFGMVVIRNVE